MTPENDGPDVTDGPLVDEQALRTYLEEHLSEPETDAYEVERHQAGHSNETFFVTWGQREMVLRRPPRGAFLPTAHDVMREYHILSQLEAAQVRTPKPVLGCESEEVLGAPFYLMERVRGEIIRDELPSRYPDASHPGRIAHELVDALAELHLVDWEEHGLDRIGKGEGYLDRQVARWQDQWERTRSHTEKVRRVPELDQVGTWLEETLPETQRTTIVHGDYKLDNVVFDGEPPELVGILDWEMATLGDPLADLGWMLSFWREKSDPTHDALPIEPRVTEAPGFPPRSALIERYEQATGLEVHDLTWYVTLATWKLAVLLEGSYARHLAGATDDPFFEHMEACVPALAKRAHATAQGERKL